MHVPLLDLKAQYAAIRGEIEPVVSEVLESQAFINGPAVAELERQVASLSSTAEAIGVSSGTDALIAALMSLGIASDLPACRTGRSCPGCPEVITTPFTFFATAGSIWRVGAKPVFVDIQPETFNIDPQRVAEAVTDRTRAILPVHLFGQVAEMEPILALAESRGLPVVEDAAQAIGSTRNGQPAGSFGAAGCLSFFPSKNLGGIGDGGMIVTNDASLADTLRQCRDHGSRPRYIHKWVGGNFRLDTLQAAALVVKLRHLEGWSAARRANAAAYDRLLADCDEVLTPVVAEGNVSIYNQYVIRCDRRDDLQAYLKDRDIHTAIYYPLALHQQECFAELGYRAGQFPHAEKAAAEVLALPIYPELTDAQIEYVAESIRSFYKG
jgi:dTDP-4-amino-4,6-dideoxygalactose transaminase